MEQINSHAIYQFHYITEIPNIYVSDEQADEYDVDVDTLLLPTMRAVATKKVRNFVNDLDTAIGGFGVAPPNKNRYTIPHEFLENSVRIIVSGQVIVKDNVDVSMTIIDANPSLMDEIQEKLPDGDIFRIKWFSNTLNQLITIEEVNKRNTKTSE